VSTPSIVMPGSFSIPSAAPVYCDGIPVTAASASGSWKATEDFWSSEPRLPGDPTYEQLVVSLGQERLINYLTVDLPQFPHTVTAWWWDGSLWQPMIGTGNMPLAFVTSACVPAIVDNPAALGAGLNPWHYGAGHWVTHSEPITPVTTTKIMLRGLRAKPAPRQKFPVGPTGRTTAYPLGARSLDFGSRLLSSSDVPASPRSPTVLTARQPFTTSSDINGSPIQVAIRENRACDLLRGATWRSGPQPASSAVVNLYLDARDGSGNAQIVDRLYLDPVTSGPRFNLYYSREAPPAGADFTAVDDPFPPELATPGGTSLPACDAQGVVFPPGPGWLTLANQGAGTVADQPWWTGMEIMPGFGPDDPGTYVVADAGLLQLVFEAGTWQVLSNGGVLASWVFDFDPGDRLQFIAGFDGDHIFAWCPPGYLAHVPIAPPIPPAPVFRFGGWQDPTLPVVPGNFRLTSWILKQEQLSFDNGLPDDFTLFAADALGYVSPHPGKPPRRAVARFHPEFVLGTTNAWGFVGGLAQAYEQCDWVPVQRDYALAKGYVEFDPVSAAAWRLEFTALQPEPFDYLQPGPVPARFFPSQLLPGSTTLNPVAEAVLDVGLTVNQSVAPAIVFADTAIRATAAATGAALATEALFARDPGAAAQLVQRGGALFNFQPWQPPAVIPCSPVAGPSTYQVTEVQVTSRVAYFVALAGVSMYRTDYTAADDTAQYLDLFEDTNYLDDGSLQPGGWTWTQGVGLQTPGNLTTGGAAVVSQVLNSAHAITGVQFATTQSDPVQLLDDPDFSDPSFASWGPVGDALPLTQAPVDAQLGNMAQVARGGAAPAQTATSPAPMSWLGLEGSYGDWGAMETAFPSWLDFNLQPAIAAIGGIGYTGDPVPTTTGGRVYVAARVLAPAALTAPLYLQLLDGLTGAVIAELEQEVAGGTVTEWFAGFTLGSDQPGQAKWSDVQTSYPTWSSVFAASPAWDVIDTTETALGTTVSAQLIQKDQTGDTWAVDNLSVFEDATLWEFSNDGGNTWYQAFDVRNNPRGVVTFPLAAPGAGNQLVWRCTAYRPGISLSSLAIRPWYVTWPHGVMPRPAGIGHGPNLTPQDHYTAIENDPRWSLSASPVPESWYFKIRQQLAITPPAPDFPGPALPPADATLGSALVYEPPAVEEIGPATWSDFYSDVFTDTYALADGGDVYTDTYCDTYGQDYLVTTGTVRSGATLLAAIGSLTAVGETVARNASALGADLGLVPASDPSVTAWTQATALPLPVRRIALGNQIPASLAASPAAGDAGVRRVLFDVRPDTTTTPGQLSAFLASCQAGNLRCAVSIWAGADQAFGDIQDYLDMLPAYVAAIRLNGYSHVFTIDNASIVRGALPATYPGDALVDVISPTITCTGPAPGSGGDTLALAASFADSHAKPFGLAGITVDHTAVTALQGQAFLAYLQQVFAGRKAAGQQNADLIYASAGGASITTAPPQIVAAYRQLAAAL
jgi:hypothetical protein